MDSDWTHVMLELPSDDAAALLLWLKEKDGFKESQVDYCELVRDDQARVSWGPCSPPAIAEL